MEGGENPTGSAGCFEQSCDVESFPDTTDVGLAILILTQGRASLETHPNQKRISMAICLTMFTSW